MHNWSDEQLYIFDTLYRLNQDKSKPHLVKIDAVAGAAKSSSLIEATRRIKQSSPQTTVRYLVFNTANSQEAKTEFGTNAIASTLHSLAYHYTVKPFNLKTPIAQYLTWKDVPKHVKIPFGETNKILNQIEAFNSSKYLDFQTYVALELRHEIEDNIWYPKLTECAQQVLDLMASGQMRVTHSFYLKLFHILLMNETLKLDPIDILLVDEVQDLTPITLDVVDQFPAQLKVLVGDPAQSIYGFMGCISAFEFYQSQGITLHLSKSFRVGKHIAKHLQRFCNKTFDQTMIFEGMEYDKKQQIFSKAYITRTNLELVSKMIELNEHNIPYKLATSAKINQMFDIPKAVIYSKPGGKQYTPELEVVQHAVDEWGASAYLQNHFSKTQYVADQCEDLQPIQEAIKLIQIHGPEKILDAYNKAESHRNSAANLTLLTAHTSKGLTFDAAYISKGLNSTVEQVLDTSKARGVLTTEERAELYLYYVACSRAKYHLENAIHVTPEDEEPISSVLTYVPQYQTNEEI